MFHWAVVFFLFPFFGLAMESPSWWTKPEYQKKIRDERQIIVSIKNQNEPGKNQNEPAMSYYEMTGAGNLKTSRSFTLKKILSFGELEKVSPYFKKVVHQPEYSRVFFLLEAYGYEARMLITYKVEEGPEKTNFHWNVVWGGFQGMIGDIELTTLKGDKTEAILKSRFDDKEIPLPNIFKSFVLEIIVQQVAKSMRGWIEDSAPAKGSL